MAKKIFEQEGVRIALIDGDEILIKDTQSALDLIIGIHYDDDCDRLAVYKEAITPEFFILSTGIAGEILQKFVNYSKKLAIIGDFSGYTSKPLKDFIYECNKGSSIFFVNSREEALKKLSKGS